MKYSPLEAFRALWMLAACVCLVASAPDGVNAQEPRAAGPSAAGVSRVTPIRAAPAGSDTVALLPQGTAVEVLERSAGWVRIRVEGWIPEVAATATGPSTSPDPGLAEVRTEPDRHAGSIVRWSVQHLGLQRADSLRSDMTMGEPYLLVRDPGGEAGLVYVAIPSELLTAATALSPLQRFTLVGRVRVGRSHLTGHPILDLLEIQQ